MIPIQANRIDALAKTEKSHTFCLLLHINQNHYTHLRDIHMVVLIWFYPNEIDGFLFGLIKNKNQ